MFCKHCGEKIENSGIYCAYCGKKNKKENKIAIKIAHYFNLIQDNYAKYIKLHKKAIKTGLGFLVGFTAVFFCITTVILPAYGKKMIQRGKSFIESKRYEEAVAAFSQAANTGSKTPEVYTYLGEAYFNLSEYENARFALDSAISEEEPSPTALKLLADVWLYEGNEAMYENTLARLIETAPNDSYAYLKLAEQYASAKRFDNAANTLEKLLERQKNPQATKLLYSIYLESYINNKSAEKAGAIKADASRYLSEIYLTPLNTAGSEAVSLSPTGNYLLSTVYDSASKFMALYELEGNGYKFHSRFKVPQNYDVDGFMISWSPDETMLAFYSSKGEAFVFDSSIYIYEILNQNLYNLTDPRENYINYMVENDIYIIDTIPCFSEDSKLLYFSRQSIKGNFLCVVDLQTKEITNLFEPENGGWVDYKIIEKSGKIYFSVISQNNNSSSGLYVYSEDGCKKLIFEYDDRYYNLALKDISKNGDYLLYYITSASQNDSLYFKVLNLDKMSLLDIYPQDIDSVNNKLSAINTTDIFGTKQIFVCRNAVFSLDGQSVLIAEDGGGYSGKTIRRIHLKSGVATFEYLSYDANGADTFCVPLNNKSGVFLKEISDGKLIIYNKELMLADISSN